jgi:nitrate/TMAO reductase-like tetraheme cytochrome c subunit
MKKIVFLTFFGICIGLVVALAAAEMIERTSGGGFCSSCHSMQGATQAYQEDIHGGANANGAKAQCVDCHLPHDNVLQYVVAKAYTGSKDVLGEVFWADTFDWVGNLKDRKVFAYTSGCRKCHDLNAIRYDIPKAFLAHKDFETGKVKSCVQCHEHVGHKIIKDFLIN